MLSISSHGLMCTLSNNINIKTHPVISIGYIPAERDRRPVVSRREASA